jgi:predicted ATPase with chaperone activity
MKYGASTVAGNGQIELSGRAYHRVLRLARIIANLADLYAIEIHYDSKVTHYRYPIVGPALGYVAP